MGHGSTPGDAYNKMWKGQSIIKGIQMSELTFQGLIKAGDSESLVTSGAKFSNSDHQNAIVPVTKDNDYSA